MTWEIMYLDNIIKTFKLQNHLSNEQICKGLSIQIDRDTCIYTLQFGDDQGIYVNDKEDLEFITPKLKEKFI